MPVLLSLPKALGGHGRSASYRGFVVLGRRRRRRRKRRKKKRRRQG